MGAVPWTADRLDALRSMETGQPREGGRRPEKWTEREYILSGGPVGLRLTVRTNLYGNDSRRFWWLVGRLIGFSAQEAAAALNAAPAAQATLAEVA